MKKLLLHIALLVVFALGQAACQSSAGVSSAAPVTAQDARTNVIKLPDELNVSAREKARQTALTRQYELANRYMASNDYGRSMDILKGVLSQQPYEPGAWYNLACVQARRGESDAAMKSLTQAVDNGFCDFRHLRLDSDLSPLRGRSDYQALLARSDSSQRSRAERIEQQVQSALGSRYSCRVDHEARMVFVSGISNERTLGTIRQNLMAQAAALRNDLFDHGLDQYVTVVVLNRPEARKLPSNGGGYYEDSPRTITTVQTGIILTHEFTHALHHADGEVYGQKHPVWIKEGLATLFETNRLEGGHILPQHNFRLRSVQSAIAKGRNIPLRKFVSMPQNAYMSNADVCYPQGRYLMMYLHANGLLKKWYQTYIVTYDRDKTGGLALEQVCGKSLDAINSDYVRWVGTLRANQQIRPGQAVAARQVVLAPVK